MALKTRDEDEVYNEIRVPPIRTMLPRRQLRWLGHLARRDDDSILWMMMSGVRRGGHPLSVQLLEALRVRRDAGADLRAFEGQC